MRITDAKVIVTCPGRNFVTLKLTTEDGLTGLGDATLNGRELSVAVVEQGLGIELVPVHDHEVAACFHGGPGPELA